MSQIKQAFELLEAEKHLEAYNQFYHICTTTKKTDMYNRAFYGQARALIGLARNNRREAEILLETNPSEACALKHSALHYDASAESLLTQLITTAPQYAAAYIALGRLYEAQNRMSEAQKVYQSGLQANNHNQNLQHTYNWFATYTPGFNLQAVTAQQNSMPLPSYDPQPPSESKRKTQP
ncbi:tetratricopeptide repeat protein [Candidatus Berkiella aquae]|uniref:Tetratricopeptide repeat protein n=1 Tax=Candidatus Berkiella aquae TaxID=295108 RepID=A0A0Q9YRS4_9GAMM|nr:tetratricopeptide repeat protein [Candidatus Berkiella aquae]MCS5709937.1 tetratricopeptide repeat protein [Candidatus Berkiella aquae]